MALKEELNIRMSKKASLGLITAIIIILVSCILIYSISFRFFTSFVDEGSQEQICKADILISNSILNKDEVNKFERVAAKTRLKNPFCITHEKILDLDKLKKEKKYKNYQDSEIMAIEMGNMITSCWSTFGNGEIFNTFGQDKKNIKFEDRENYYFPCYAFKFKSKNRDLAVKGVPTSFFEQLFWLYNLKGQPLPNLKKIKNIDDAKKLAPKLLPEAIDHFLEGDKNYQTYATNIFLSHPGYLEFMETVDPDFKYATDDAKDFEVALVAGGTTAAAGFATGVVTVGVTATTVIFTAPIILVAAAVGGIGYLVAAQFKDVEMLGPRQGKPLDKIYTEKWYEVRYYSPYIKLDDKKKYEEFVLNSIKIMPYDAKSVGGDLSEK